MPPTRSPSTFAVQRAVLLTSETPLRTLWVAIYRAAARLFVVCVLWREWRASAYVRLEGPDFLPGLSDVDIVIVLRDGRRNPGAAALRVRRRAGHLRGRKLLEEFPIVDDVRVYEQSELRDLVGTTALTYGLEGIRPTGRRPRAYVGEAGSADPVRLLTRPGLYGTLGDWRRLIGPDRRPTEPPRDPQLERIDAWLELVFWWRMLPRGFVHLTGPRLPDLCVKCVAESVRIWVWLTSRERLGSRREALERGIALLPEEQDGFRQALELQRSLTRWPEESRGLEETLPTLVRMSTRIAGEVDAAASVAGFTRVGLAGHDPAEPVLAGGEWKPNPALSGGWSPDVLPLVDWRGIAFPLAPDDTFVPLAADPTDPAAYSTAAGLNDGPYPTLLADRLLIRPGMRFVRTRMRAVECRATDPVSFALLERARTAAFPNLRGWSIADTAARAVAEHKQWVFPRHEPSLDDGGARELGRLLSAVRAAVLLHSVATGEPELPVTVTEGVRMLVRAGGGVGAQDALGHYQAFVQDGLRPPATTVAEMRALVRGLPAYASS